MEPLVLCVRGRTKRGKRDELQQLFEKHLAPRAKANPAQQLVVWAADDADADGFAIVEIYRDREAADANAQTEWFAEYLAAATPLLEGQPAMSMGTPRWVKGVRI